MAIGKKVSPAKFLGELIQGGINIIGGFQDSKKAKGLQKDAKKELEAQKQAFRDLDTSNLYANVQNPYAGIQTNFENVYEDLTVNQQQAQFQAQQGAQQRSNIMQDLRGAAGGSGIAALAQQMANQGQLATQQASASIGQQEAANQRAMARGAAGVQQMENQAQLTMAGGEAAAQQQRLAGAEASRELEYGKTQGLLSMASGEMQAANEARQAAKDRIMGGVGQGFGAYDKAKKDVLSFFTGGIAG
jgi:hypothetical protein